MVEEIKETRNKKHVRVNLSDDRYNIRFVWCVSYWASEASPTLVWTFSSNAVTNNSIACMFFF